VFNDIKKEMTNIFLERKMLENRRLLSLDFQFGSARQHRDQLTAPKKTKTAQLMTKLNQMVDERET